MKRRQDKLIGIEGDKLLQRAAREMDALGKQNARIVEVDSQAHTYTPSKTDIFYIEKSHHDGSWSADGIADIAGQGALCVHRDLRDNLLPALTMQLIEKLVRGGVFHNPEDAKRHVLDDCRFVAADLMRV
jgi:hypothetical protein